LLRHYFIIQNAGDEKTDYFFICLAALYLYPARIIEAPASNSVIRIIITPWMRGSMKTELPMWKDT